MKRSVAALVAGVTLSVIPSKSVAAEPEPVAKPVASGQAGDLTDAFFALDEEIKVQVASRRSESLRQAPAVLTVLTREEILASGARDLADLLALVPGFGHYVDVWNFQGVSVRGLPATSDGRLLLLVDGIETNELLYQSVPVGMNWLVQNLERVEIIRGPGSAIYGGAAGLAVVNLVTRGAKELEGIEVQGRYGQMVSTFSDRSIGVNAGKTFMDGALGLSLSGYVGEGNRSGRLYRTYAGDEYRLNANRAAGTDPAHVNLGITFKGVTARFLYDDYRANTVDGYGELTTFTPPDTGVAEVRPNQTRYQLLAGDVRGSFKVGDRVTLMPRLSGRWQRAWAIGDPAAELYFDTPHTRLLASFAANVDILESLSLLAGVDGSWDHAYVPDPALVGTGLQVGYADYDPNKPNSIDFFNFASYLQLQWQNPIVDLTAGARFEYHSAFGPSFVPRLVATKRVGRFNAKLLWSQSFRAPAIEQIRLAATSTGMMGNTIRPERNNTFEAEVAYDFTDFMTLSLSGFSANVSNTIVYTVDPVTQVDGYRNGAVMGSLGLETELALKGKYGLMRLNYSLAALAPWYDEEYYLVPGTKRPLGIPQHKVAAFGKLKLPLGFSVNPSVVVWGPRDAITSPDEPQTGVLPTQVVANAFIGWEAPETTPVKGLSVAVGVNNIFNADAQLVQVYNGGHPPMPGRERDFFLRLGYHLGGPK